MADYKEQIADLEEEIRKTAYNKRTQHHIGLLKAKVAQLRNRQEKRSGGGKKEGFAVRKTGDGTIALIGFPSVGKSTLLNALTGTVSKTAQYAFTTLTCIPGLLHYRHAKIQILDLPGIVRGAATGVGKGREVLSVLRSADSILLVLDVAEPTKHYESLLKELYNADIRVNKQPADVRIQKTERGGIILATTVKLTHLTKETVKGILREFKLINASIVIREDITADELIDVVEGNKHYIKMRIAINKIDNATPAQIKKIQQRWPEALFVSAQEQKGIAQLKSSLFQTLQLMRIYLKEVGKTADMEEPLIIKQGSTIKDVCNKLHKDFVMTFRFARVWGPSAKFEAQKLSLHHTLKDKDILQIFLR